MNKLGLIGYPLEHSFSKKYFTQKFKNEGWQDWKYEMYPLVEISRLQDLLSTEDKLKGLNVTIPHKISVIPFLDSLDEEAAKVGSVNTIKVYNINGRKKLKGFNTDVYGFEKSLVPLLKPNHTRALVLGSGGASKAVKFVLQKLGIEFNVVSRSDKYDFSYQDLNKDIYQSHCLIINTTPIGMFPHTEAFPPVFFRFIGSGHLLYDLIYNPEETEFMRRGKQRGATVKNGLEMLHLQAERSWEIWQDDNL